MIYLLCINISVTESSHSRERKSITSASIFEYTVMIKLKILTSSKTNGIFAFKLDFRKIQLFCVGL